MFKPFLLTLFSLSAFAQPRFTVQPQVVANPNPRVPLAALVRFETSVPVAKTIIVSDGSRRFQLTYDEKADARKGLAILGMRPDTAHRIEIEIRDKAGKTAKSEVLEYRTPKLPSDADEIPPIQVRASHPSRMEPGITIASVRRGRGGFAGAGGGQKGGRKGVQGVATVARGPDAFSTEFGLLLGLDAEGKVCWYYRSNRRISDFTMRRNGNIVYLTDDFQAIEIDRLGNVLASWYAKKRPQGPAKGLPVDTLTFHHAIVEMPNGNLLVQGDELREIDNYYSDSTDLKKQDTRQKVMGDEIVEFDRTGKVVWKWNAFDHLDPFFVGNNFLNNYWAVRGFPNTVDWTHGNGLFFDERTNSVLANFRMLSGVINIDHATGKMRWILSAPGGWPAAQQPLLFKGRNDSDFPWYHHAPFLTPRGTILVYNNATPVGRPSYPIDPPDHVYSRAEEFKIDLATRQARSVWSSDEYGPESMISGAMGDAVWLPKTGNILICYGASRKPAAGRAWPCIREVTHTEKPEVLFEVVLTSDPAPTGVMWQMFSARHASGFGVPLK